MPGDFREPLYRRYVSTFKGATPLDQNGSDDWWDHKYLPLLNGLARNASILEIGCGSGRLLAYLGRRGYSHATGVDISDEQVQVARARGVKAERSDALAFLEARSAPLDAIIGVDVFEHLTRDELLRLAPMLQSALAPGGRLILQTANGAGLLPGQVIYGDLTHVTIFTPQSLEQLLRGAGFDHFSFSETGPVPLRFRGKIDVALWAAIKALANAARSIESGKRQTIWTENFICRAFRPG